MAKLKIYDGAKWVIPDADTVDGKHASDFAAASHGNHVPTIQTADARKFLRNDNTWQSLPTASTSATGIVQLSDSCASTSSTTAASSKAVNTAYTQATTAYNNSSQAIESAASALNIANKALPLTGGTINGPLQIGERNPLTLYHLKAVSENDQVWSEGGLFPYSTDTYNMGNAQFKWSEVWGKRSYFDRFIRRTTGTSIQHGQAAAYGIESSDNTDKITVGIGLLGTQRTMYPGQTLQYDLGINDYRWKSLWLGNFNKSLSGYNTLPNGMIVQWGYTGTSTNTTLIYPVAFTSNSSYSITITPYYSADATGLCFRTYYASAGSIQIFCTKSCNFYWMAVGW